MTLPPAMIVDTNVVSYLFKSPRHPKTRAYRTLMQGNILLVSFMTVGELWQGVEQARWEEVRREELRQYLRRYPVAPASVHVAETWGVLMGLSKRDGHNLSHADAWIAATALTRDAPLVSDNARHFQWIPGLRLLTA